MVNKWNNKQSDDDNKQNNSRKWVIYEAETLNSATEQMVSIIKNPLNELEMIG